MAMNEIALISLAWNLAIAPAEIDIAKYDSLSKIDQVKVQQLIEQKDLLPLEIENLIKRGPGHDIMARPGAPTSETFKAD